MLHFFQVIHVIISVVLIGLILIQSGKGQGLTGAFGASTAGSKAQHFFGARTGDVLTKITSYLCALFFVSAISLAFFQVKSSESVVKDYAPIQKSQTETQQAVDIKKTVSDLTDKLLKKTSETEETTETLEKTTKEPQGEAEETSEKNLANEPIKEKEEEKNND